MKKLYQKPSFEFIDFAIDEKIMNGIVDGSASEGEGGSNWWDEE